MDWDPAQIIIAIAGGGTGTGLLVKLWQILKERNEGKLDREDTAIRRWQAIAEEYEEQAHRMAWELDWYRANYAAVRAEWLQIPPQDASLYPAVPPPPRKQS